MGREKNPWADNGLYGNGKYSADAQGQLKVGDRVGVFVDLDGGEGGDGGSVRFFVNGSEYGPGFKSGVKGPVVLGVQLYGIGQVVTLLPDAQKPGWPVEILPKVSKQEQRENFSFVFSCFLGLCGSSWFRLAKLISEVCLILFAIDV